MYNPTVEWPGFGRGGSKYTGLVQSVVFAVVGALLLPVRFKGVPVTALFLLVGIIGTGCNLWWLRPGGRLNRPGS